MDNVFIQLAVMLSAACAIGFVAIRFRLPLVIAYLLAGVYLSTLSIADSDVLHTLPEIGIAFVLFLIGMELNLSDVRSIGRPVAIATLLQVVVSSIAGFGLATLFGFSGNEAMVIGISLAFASTVIIVKVLSERRDVSSLYGKLSIGILLMEDLIAILAMVAITENVFSTGVGPEMLRPLLEFSLIALALIVLAYLISRYVLDPILTSVARSIELLFLTAITWCFVFTSLATLAGFSVVIGAFLAGVALASSPYQLQIQGKVKPIRDFFVALFFIYIGTQVDIQTLTAALPAILGLTAFALLIKPLIYLLGLALFKFRKHTLFQTSLNLTQVSEFSLIIALLAVESGIASQTVLTVVSGAAVLSMVVSSIALNYSDPLYKRLKPFVKLFERKEAVDILPTPAIPKLEGHIVIIGADRIGGAVIRHLEKAKINSVILDYNPNIVRELRAKGFPALYGDASDPEVTSELQLSTAKLVISTASGLMDNLMLLEAVKIAKSNATIVVRTGESENEKILKDAGANYVMLPERVSGDFLVSKLEDEWPNLRF